jgi:heme/copper-type cytochrome/quinol oxidase subunit 2
MKKQLLLLFCCTMLLAVQARSQGCSVCTKTTASLDAEQARGLNGGIVFLALLPLGIIGTLGTIWWRYNRGKN